MVLRGATSSTFEAIYIVSEAGEFWKWELEEQNHSETPLEDPSHVQQLTQLSFQSKSLSLLQLNP